MQNWPQPFLERMKSELGDEYQAFLESLSTVPPVSIRLNPFKPGFNVEGLSPVPWCNSGYYLPQRPAFIFDPLFHAGTYYVQEASSMFLETVYRQVFPDESPKLALDMCAAPGGKSTHLLALLSSESLLLSNEIIPKRNAILRQNLVKWGNANVFVTQNNPEDFSKLGSLFDLVVVDAPCSGEGLFRRDPEAAEEWSEEAVQHCAVRQRDILQQAMSALKRGGILIYSTCTFEKAEDEGQIKALIDSGEAELIELGKTFEGIVQTSFGLRFYPHKILGEGFFISALRKTGNDEHAKKVKKTFLLQRVPEAIAGYFRDASNFRIFVHEERVYAIPVPFVDTFLHLSETLFIRQAGIFAGTVKGKDFIPSHDLALNVQVNSDNRVVDLEEDKALLFLKGEPVPVDSVEKGWHLASYKGLPLGWIKVLQGRVNNYLPKEWRIHKELPEEYR